MDLPINEVDEAAALVKEVVDPSCNIIFGAGIDESLSEEVEITVIATGFNQKLKNQKEDDSFNLPKVTLSGLEKPEVKVEPEIEPKQEQTTTENAKPGLTSVVKIDAKRPAWLDDLRNKR